VQEGDPKFSASQDLPDVPYHRFAELIGLKGIYVDDPQRLGAAWDEALAADRPVLLEVRTDPNVPPLPPHITLKQARHFASTLLHGDPNEAGTIAGTVKELLSALLPGHKPSKTR
jgi:pyruvate dehydrogenase (quinone)